MPLRFFGGASTPSVRTISSGDYQLTAGDFGNTVRFTGSGRAGQILYVPAGLVVPANKDIEIVAAGTRPLEVQWASGVTMNMLGGGVRRRMRAFEQGSRLWLASVSTDVYDLSGDADVWKIYDTFVGTAAESLHSGTYRSNTGHPFGAARSYMQTPYNGSGGTATVGARIDDTTGVGAELSGSGSGNIVHVAPLPSDRYYVELDCGPVTLTGVDTVASLIVAASSTVDNYIRLSINSSGYQIFQRSGTTVTNGSDVQKGSTGPRDSDVPVVGTLFTHRAEVDGVAGTINYIVNGQIKVAASGLTIPYANDGTRLAGWRSSISANVLVTRLEVGLL